MSQAPSRHRFPLSLPQTDAGAQAHVLLVLRSEAKDICTVAPKGFSSGGALTKRSALLSWDFCPHDSAILRPGVGFSLALSVTTASVLVS